MEFLKSWKNSLEYFLPVKLFKKSLVVWFKTFWWIPLFFALLAIVDFMFPMQFFIFNIEYINIFNLDLVRYIIFLIFALFFLFSIFTSVIFSAKNKKISGVCNYFFYWFLFSFPFIIVPIFLMDVLPFFIPYFLFSTIRFFVSNGLVVVGAFFAFFLLESKVKKTGKVFPYMVKAFKMVFAYYPLYLLIMAISFCVYQGLVDWIARCMPLFRYNFFVVLNLFSVLQLILFFVIFFVASCVLAEFYFKKTKK